MIVYQIVRDIEDLGVRGQDVRQLGQVELGTADLHPERVVDVDDVAAAVGRTSVCNFLKKEKIIFYSAFLQKVYFSSLIYHTGVNFINILRTNFLYERRFSTYT